MKGAHWWLGGLLTLLGLVGLYWLLYWIVGPQEPEERNEVVRTFVQSVGGLVLVSGAYVTWRNMRVNQRNQQINLDNQLENQKANRERERLTQEGQVTERYTKAVEQLGSDKLAVRLGGIYALEQIARDSERDYWPILEVLTAYVRANAAWDEEQSPKRPHKTNPWSGFPYW